MRHLQDYTFGKIGRRRKGLSRQEPCRDRFTKERWDSFETDIGALLRTGKRPGRLHGGSLMDKGYNGTPLHSFVMGKLGKAIGTLDVVTVARMTLVDIWGICAIGFMLCLALGWQAGMVCSIYYFVAAADRFDITGGSPSRYYWMFFLALGVVALVRKRGALAGVGLTLSTALVAFPLFYWLGAAAALFGKFLRGQARQGKRFLISCSIVGTLCLLLGAAHSRGVGNYDAWMEDMRIHSVDSRPRDVPPGPMTATPGFGLGLKFAMMYSVREDGRRNRSARLLEYRRVRPVYHVLGWGLLLAGLLVAIRLRPAAACVLIGSLGFWAIQGTVGYYFVCASLLPVMLVSGWRSGKSSSPIEALASDANSERTRWAPEICAALEAVLWVINAFALFQLARTEDRFFMMQVHLSIGLGLWMLAALAAFAWMGQPLRWIAGRFKNRQVPENAPSPTAAPTEEAPETA